MTSVSESKKSCECKPTGHSYSHKSNLHLTKQSTCLPPQAAHSVVVTDASSSSNPTRVLGWKTSKTFSKTMSSIEVAPNKASTASSSSILQQSSSTPTSTSTSASASCCSSSSAGAGIVSSSTSSSSTMRSPLPPRPAAIRIQMESVGPSAYSLSLQQRNASEQWKLLKNRLLRKKSTEEANTPVTFSEVVIDRMRQMRRLSPHTMQESSENGIVCKTNELKKILKSESSDISGRSSNRNSFDGAAVNINTSGSENQSLAHPGNSESIATEAESSSSPSSSSAVESTVKWDEVRASLPLSLPLSFSFSTSIIILL